VTGAYFRLHPGLREVLISTLRWEEFRSVQEESLASFREGKDLLILAPTAGGKTESAFLPALHDLLIAGTPGIGILYLSPAKALINDQYLRITRITAPLGLEARAWHGDVERSERTWQEDDPPHILLTTPESLEVLLMDHARRGAFLQLRSVIVDEVHTFIGSDRGVQLRCLLERLDRLCRRQIPRIALSATIGNPDDLLAWFSGPTRNGACIRSVSPPSPRRFSFIFEPREERRIRSLAGVVAGKKVLLFTGSRSEAERVHASLSSCVASVFVHHSAVSLDIRKAAEEEMAGSGPACIICTTTLELGIDIGRLNLVVQYGAPDSVASFLQRLGRSGRRDKPPEMVFLLASAEEALLAAAAIEAARYNEVEPVIPPAFPCHVFVQQLFLQLLASRGQGRQTLCSMLLSLPPFGGICKDDADQIIDHLLGREYLVMDGDLLAIGPSAERELSRSHWIALCSVIANNREYHAVTLEGETIGTLDPAFVETAAVTGFRLAGRSWRIVSRDDSRRGLLVAPSNRVSPRPFWSGSEKKGISRLLAESVARIVKRGRSDLPLPLEMHDAIVGVLYSMPEGITSERMVVVSEPLVEGTLVSVWTFLGDRLNETIAHLVRHLLPLHWEVHSTYAVIIAAVPSDEDAETAKQIVCDGLIQLASLPIDEIGAWMPALPAETLAFGWLLPDAILRRMAAIDLFHVTEALAAIREGFRTLR